MWSTPNYIPLKNAPVKRLAVYDTGDVHSDTQASKPVLFFLHGLGVSSLLWKYAFAHLRNNYRCIAADLPGHGNSWNERGNFSMSFYAQTIRACIEAMGLGEITLVGHSMGGQIAIITALQIPSIAERVVLVSPAGIETFAKEEGEKIIQATEFFYRAPTDLGNVISIYQSQFAMHPERVRELAEEHITQQQERFSLFSETIISSVSGMLHEPVHAFLPHLHQPVLILFGEQDKLIPNKWIHPGLNMQAVAQAAKTKLHHAQVEILQGCGHYLPFEQPHEMAEKLLRFHLG
jgi:pimeloyl-ACP methyl ester carboxylesterase